MIIMCGEPIRLANGDKNMIGDKYEAIKDIVSKNIRKGNIFTCETKGGIMLALYDSGDNYICQIGSPMADKYFKRLI